MVTVEAAETLNAEDGELAVWLVHWSTSEHDHFDAFTASGVRKKSACRTFSSTLKSNPYKFQGPALSGVPSHASPSGGGSASSGPALP